ncbi:MAG: hypothetical protein KDE59_06730 [Anaerolineales bacterium]|nr:hypothetical protein [Anaerolineales bacterium]MCB0030367.1 hypothetical protein [Anaerolineales bacterium]MCB8961322.1 hypothetical protein [Ardenticatenales bacterium]
MVSRRHWIILGVVGGFGCLAFVAVVIVVLAGGLVMVAGDLDAEAATVESTAPDAAQIDLCRNTLGIRAEVELTVEYYLFQPGFLDDRLECRFRVEADTLDDIFIAGIDPYDEGTQELAPGRFLQLTIENPTPGVYLITGYWFET